MGRNTKVATQRLCAEYRRRLNLGDRKRDIITDLAVDYGVGRTAVHRALHRHGEVPPYQPKRPGGPGRPVGGGEPGYTLKRIERSVSAREAVELRRDQLRLATAEPCLRCGVRADVGCRHRAAEGPAPLAIDDPEPPPDGRSRPAGGQGWNFHTDQFAEAVERARQSLAPLR